MKYLVDRTAQRFIRCVSENAASRMPACGGLLRDNKGISPGELLFGSSQISDSLQTVSEYPVCKPHLVRAPEFYDGREAHRYGTGVPKGSVALLDSRSPYATVGELLDSEEMHFVTRSNSYRRSGGVKRFHTHDSPYPPGSFWLAGDEFAFATPGLSFLQLGTTDSLLQMVQYGSELCGTFSMPATGGGDMITRKKPLTTPQQLMSYIESANGMHGIENARKALRHVVPMSASPMETKIEMFLCLPRHMGGNGVGKPVMNMRVPLSEAAQMISSRKFVKCDLCWPSAKFDLEYDSRTFHSEISRIRKDMSRTAGLTVDDWTVMQLTEELVYDFDSLECVARDILRRTGQTYRTGDMRRYKGVRQELHYLLFKSDDAFWW